MPIATHWAITSQVVGPGLGIMRRVGDGLGSGVTDGSPVIFDKERSPFSIVQSDL